MDIYMPQQRAPTPLPLNLPEDLLDCTLSGFVRPVQVSYPIKNDSVMWPGPLPLDSALSMPLESDPFPDFSNLPACLDPYLDPYLSSGEEHSFDGDMDGFSEAEHVNFQDFLNMESLGAPDNETPGDGAGDGGVVGAQTTAYQLFKHFETTNSVGSFRINQENQKLIANGVATQESLGFSNPLLNGTLRGIKQGSLQGAATPLTPERHHKQAAIKSPLEMNKMKRKAPEEDNAETRKRQRSTSDVMTMAN